MPPELLLAEEVSEALPKWTNYFFQAFLMSSLFCFLRIFHQERNQEVWINTVGIVGSLLLHAICIRTIILWRQNRCACGSLQLLQLEDLLAFFWRVSLTICTSQDALPHIPLIVFRAVELSPWSCSLTAIASCPFPSQSSYKLYLNLWFICLPQTENSVFFLLLPLTPAKHLALYRSTTNNFCSINKWIFSIIISY